MPPRIVLVTPPTAEPVTLAEAKLFLRVDVTDDDALITELIAAARKRNEEKQGRAYVTQTWDLFLDEWPEKDGPIEVPRPPLQSVTSVKYTKSGGSVVTLAATEYYVDTASEPGRVVLNVDKSWPSDELRSANGIEVRFVAGYGAASTVPEQIKDAVKELVAHWYEHRDLGQEIPRGIDLLLYEKHARKWA